MPRAFLIKKKRHYGLSSSLPAKKRSSASVSGELPSQVLHNGKGKDYESGSESGCSTPSGQMPSPASSPNAVAAAFPTTAAALDTPSSLGGDVYGRPTVLEPLNLNASAAAAAAAVPWMKPFLTPYLPFNFPHALPYSPHPSYRSDAPYPAHFLPASPPSSHRVVHSHQALSVPRGSLYPSRSEPPSPSCPCPLSPDTPPRDGTPVEKEPPKFVVDDGLDGKRALFGVTPAAKMPSGYADGRNANPPRVDARYSPTFWIDSDRCSSNGSVQSDGGRDAEERMVVITDREESPKNLALHGGSGGGGGARRRSQDGGPRYQCPDCNKSYSTFSGLSKHQQFHCSTTNKKSFSCKYCEKVYMSLGALKMHIRTHTLPCKCKLCGKAFSRPWLLQGHIRTHTGEKPFACPHCNRAFADRSNLRAHLQTHSDVKKYSCKTCAKTFSRMSLLLKHADGGCAAANGGATGPTAFTQERLGP